MYLPKHRKYADSKDIHPTRALRRLGAVGCALAASTALLLVTAPDAAAVVARVAVAPSDNGYRVGCPYTVTATLTYQPETVVFKDMTEDRSLGAVVSVDKKATTTWTPTVTGVHTLAAYTGVPRPSLTKYVDVDVTGASCT
ncbi:hypothetical protein [Nocardia sp. NPDC052566]|uniref:hypothetical protein n=1 Tax=Nocardia sp. NPDC052566 TaxID=3364330 RepID=UPI0037CBC48A